MWGGLGGAYLAVIIALMACAGWVAVFVKDEKQADRAYKVLKLVLVTATGAGGVIAVITTMNELNVTWPALP